MGKTINSDLIILGDLIKSGSTNNDILLGGGGTIPLSGVTGGVTGDFLPLSGGTLTGNINVDQEEITSDATNGILRLSSDGRVQVIINKNNVDELTKSFSVYKNGNSFSAPNNLFEVLINGVATLSQWSTTNIDNNGDSSIITKGYADNKYSVTESSGLEALDEGNGVGYRLVGRNAGAYNNVGLNSVDFSDRQGSTSSDWGASGDYAFAHGNLIKASGLYSFGQGYLATASGTNSIAMGNTAQATGPYSIAMGNLVTAGGFGGVALGSENSTIGFGALALGSESVATGNFSTVIGRGLNSLVNETQLGKFNQPVDTSGSGNILFNIGNGTNSSTLKNAFTIMDNDSVGIGFNRFWENNNGIDKLQVNGLVKADGYKITGGTSNDVLLGDGTTTELSGLTGGTSTVFEGYDESGTRSGGDLIVGLGDYDQTGNSTYFRIDDTNESFSLNTTDGNLSMTGDTANLNGQLNVINDYTLNVLGNGQTSNPFNASLNINSGNDTSTANSFPIYNSINKQPATNSSALVYGISNLVEHEGVGDISQMRAIFNRVRVDGSGISGEYTAAVNQIEYRNTGSGTTGLMVGSETEIEITNTSGTGTINNIIGNRGTVTVENPNITVINGFSGIFDLNLVEGTINNYNVIQLDVDQAGGTWTNGSYISIGGGVNLSAATANEIKVINSVVDLPSEFAGTIEAKELIVTSKTSDDILLGDGTTTSLSGITIDIGSTVAGLPSGVTGERTFVTDATTTTFYSIVVGGGTNTVPVFYNGTDWVIG